MYICAHQKRNRLHSMNLIDLDTIIARQSLDKGVIASQLFPTNNHPRAALNRVLRGEAKLDSEQLSRLALILNCSVADLYQGANWKTVKANKGEIALESGRFKAVLRTDTWITELYDLDSLFHTSVIHSGAIELSAYIELLNTYIKKYYENKD